MIDHDTRIVNTELTSETRFMETRNRLGAYVRARRETLGISGRMLSAALGIEPTMLSRIETGAMKTLPEPELLRNIAAALSVPMSALLEAAGYGDPAAHETPPDPLIEEFVMLMNQIEWDAKSAHFVRSVLLALAQTPAS